MAVYVIHRTFFPANTTIARGWAGLLIGYIGLCALIITNTKYPRRIRILVVSIGLPIFLALFSYIFAVVD